MLFRPLSALILFGAVCFVTPSAWAQNDVSEAPAGAKEVRGWLMRIHEAAGRRNFQGTFVVSGGGAVSSSRIAHFCEGKDQFERSESLDGQARHVFRHNDVVYTVWPGSRVALVERRGLLTSFPALLQAGDDHIVDHYDVRPQKVIERVAGQDANVLLVTPRDSLRYGYRLWSDKASGLLLRADVITPGKEVLESSAFSDVKIDVKPQPESVLQPIKKLSGYRVLRPALMPTTLESEGWSLPSPVAGFRQVSCVRRPMDGIGLVDKDGGADPVLQTIYSDGLTYVSVFIEPFNERRHKSDIEVATGATRTMMRRLGNSWVTVVGDVPSETLRRFADGLRRSK